MRTSEKISVAFWGCLFGGLFLVLVYHAITEEVDPNRNAIRIDSLEPPRASFHQRDGWHPYMRVGLPLDKMHDEDDYQWNSLLTGSAFGHSWRMEQIYRKHWGLSQ